MGNTSCSYEIKYKDLILHEKIGQGQNDVYRVTWRSPDGPRPAAAKNCCRFRLKEVEILSQLRHPNIIEFFGCVREPFHDIILTELACKGSLYHFIHSNRPQGGAIEVRLWRRWSVEGASALNYIHSQNVQHGDIKSPNFVIMQDETLKLCDLGTAKDFKFTVDTASIRGSWPWMAPEAMGKMTDSPKVTTKSDIYSFAVVLWEMLTGQEPFPGQNQLDIYKTVCERNERLLIPDSCCAHIRCLMNRAWDADWSQRPSTAEVLAVLRRHQTVVGKWRLHQEISYPGKFGKVDEKSDHAIGISTFASGDIVVADRYNKLVAVCKPEGRQKTITVKTGVCGVASLNSCLIITDDTNRVTTYSTDTSLASEFTVMATDIMAGSSEHAHPYLQGVTSVAVAHDGSILLLGDTTRNVITKHRCTDGLLLQTLHLDMKPNYIATNSKGQVIVSGGWLGRVICLDGEGTVLFSIKPFVYPETRLFCAGVCCDSADEIYIGIYCPGLKTGRVHHYTSKGVFIDSVVQGLNGPCGIAFTVDGSLAVADRDAVKLFTVNS